MNRSQKWYRRAKPTASIVPLTRFVSPTCWALKNGGYGCLFSLAGVDDEGLTDEAVSRVIDRVYGALQTLPPGARLYQYVRIRRGFPIPRQAKYDNPVLETFVSDRIRFLNKNAGFHRVELFWALTIEPPGLQPKMRRLAPDDYARQSARLIADLTKAAELLVSNLAHLVGLRTLEKQEVASFFSYLLNLEDWSLDRKLTSDHNVDRQLAGSSVSWHRDHLRVGKRHVQIFTLFSNPAASRPNLFASLLSIDTDLILCTCWAPATRQEVEKRIGQIEGFIGIFKNKVLALAANLRNPENLDKTVGARAAEKGTDRLAEILSSIDNDGQQFGHYSLFLMLHARDEEEVRTTIPVVHKALVEAQAPYVEESIGNLAAYYAMFPGHSTGDIASNFNVRQFWLRADHNANLALVFAPYLGSVQSDDLGHEYLNVFETRTGTPFFLDPYAQQLRNTLILGASRSGKSVHGNLAIAHEQKYGGLTYIFDIGGSYESTIRLYGGAVEPIGINSPRVNPFLLPETEENLNFLFHFIRLLLTSGGAQLQPEDEDTINKAVRRMYLIQPNVRRLQNLLLPKHLQRYLDKWVEGGVYGSTFDNVEDSLALHRIQCFDFQGITEQQRDLIEPLLVWILRQINTVIYDPANLGVPKHIVFDELWKQLKNRELLDMVFSALKTGGKHLAGATLLTQSAEDLGLNADLIVNACTTTLFLPDPTFNRARYQDLFDLNEQELLNLASLAPREGLLKRADYSKIIRLNLDPRSYWIFSTRPKDRERRLKAIEQYGYERAFEYLSLERTA